MINQILNYKWLILIVLLASILRLWNLTNYPAGFNADEATIGYNAYSLIQTGKDEYGERFPLVFKSFGDYKPGLYFYIVIPFVYIFGLTEFAVRLPSALFGIGTVVLIYFLARKIFESHTTGLISAFLLTITPWHIHFSRGGWESNVATFFIALGVLFFMKGLENTRYLFLAIISFLFSMYTYQSPRLIIPILLILLIIFYWKKITIILPSIIAKQKLFVLVVVLSIPLATQFFSPSSAARFQGLSFLADLGPKSRVDQLRGHHQDLSNLDAKILHNKITAYTPSFLGHYLDHFNSQFLFIKGDEVIRNKIPESGQFYLIESLFLIIGVVFLAVQNIKHKNVLILWLLVAPLASSMTFQTPNALRSLNMVIPLVMVMGYGVSRILNYKLFFKLLSAEQILNFVSRILFILIIVSLIFETIHYLESYYVHYPKRYPLAWEYGFSEMVQKLGKYEGNFDKIVITDRYDQPHILVLFYKKYDPSKYQPQAILSPRDKFNFGTVRSFDKYQFREISPKEVNETDNVLFVGTEKEIPKEADIIDKVDFPNNKPAFIFAKKNIWLNSQ